MARAQVAAVANGEVIAVDGDVVPDGSRRPAEMRAGFVPRKVTHAIQKNIRPDGERLRDELMPVIARVAVLDQAKLAVVQNKSVAAAAGDFGNRIQRRAVAHGDVAHARLGRRGAGERHARVGEIAGGDIARPAIRNRTFKMNEFPRVVFIRKIIGAGGGVRDN